MQANGVAVKRGLDRELSIAMDALTHLENHVEVLSDRLIPVRVNNPNTCGTVTTDQPKEAVCPAADAVREISGRVDHISERIRFIESSLDI